MNIQPKTEQQLKSFSNLKPGEYPFTVMESDVVLSKSAKNAGREMVKVKLNVHGPDFDRHVYDYFADWFSEYKLKHFCETVGIGKDYLSGKIDPARNAWQGREGYVKIDIQEASGNYPEKNEAVDYLPEESQKVEASPAPKAAAAPPAEGDDVPF